mmetsp:Transcript_20325/g.36994  ORF Transcript_20325/g.36994 Transcript_20325/m.36994 type:complete len:290 (-) Transcript_20325:480-1349(-)
MNPPFVLLSSVIGLPWSSLWRARSSLDILLHSFTLPPAAAYFFLTVLSLSILEKISASTSSLHSKPRACTPAVSSVIVILPFLLPSRLLKRSRSLTARNPPSWSVSAKMISSSSSSYAPCSFISFMKSKNDSMLSAAGCASRLVDFSTLSTSLPEPCSRLQQSPPSLSSAPEAMPSIALCATSRVILSTPSVRELVPAAKMNSTNSVYDSLSSLFLSMAPKTMFTLSSVNTSASNLRRILLSSSLVMTPSPLRSCFAKAVPTDVKSANLPASSASNPKFVNAMSAASFP